MIFGNILTEEDININNLNKIEDINDINNSLPTIIIGWEKTKIIIGEDNVSILHKKIKNDLYWTFNQKERKVDYELDIENFKDVCLNEIENKIKYIYVDVLHDTKRKIKKIINKIIGLEYIITYKNNKNMLYIFGEGLVFGIDLNMCEFIGIEKNKIIEKVNNISDVTLHQNEIFNICKDLITNNREKIIPYIYYNGTNNKNSNSSIIC